MNLDNLHELINRYEAKIDLLYGKEHDELFKWCAVKCWRDEWFKPADSFPNFAERFAEIIVPMITATHIITDITRLHTVITISSVIFSLK